MKSIQDAQVSPDHNKQRVPAKGKNPKMTWCQGQVLGGCNNIMPWKKWMPRGVNEGFDNNLVQEEGDKEH